MESALQKLAKILELEKQGGYQNRAVIGGLERYVPVWVEEARRQASSEVEKAFVEQAADILVEYGTQPGTAARAKMVVAIRERLDRALTRKDTLLTESPAVTGHAPAQPDRPSAVEPPQNQVVQEAAPVAPVDRPARRPDHRTQESAAESAKGLQAPVETLRGIGPRAAEQMTRLGIKTIKDLVTFFPRRYVDFSLLKPINRLDYGEQVTIVATVIETTAQQTRGQQRVVRSVVSDGTASIQCTWFNQPWLAGKLAAGTTILLSGTTDQYLGRLVMTSPEWELVDREHLHTGRIVPVYSLTAGLSARVMRSYVKRAVDYWARRIPDPVPSDIRQRQGLVGLETALLQVHFPDGWDQLATARRRLAFDELLLLQIGLLRQRRQWRTQSAVALRVPESWLESLLQTLPFTLTEAQLRVTDEILGDLESAVPMNRLLQGDVGSGKTVVSAIAMAAAVEAGSQAALMAPTEILAEQHAKSISGLFPHLPVRLLTGSVSATDKQRIYEELTDGRARLVVGTHAIIQEGVTFQNLGLVVVDEQHRFGVEQRAALRQKGHNPHLLLMTATPIPRTLALTLFGDLDLSVIDKLPPGRQEIITKWIEPSMRERAYRFIRSQVADGRQAFIICPLVEASDSGEAKSAVEEHKRLQGQVFTDLKVGLLHGRMKSEEKDTVMQSFHRGETHILVSTSVVEVGIDVPNATVMLVEGADRFGLAQLHQFRGRVGRGAFKSHCLLLAETASAEAGERLSALEATSDGFVLAEKDLELRGPGEFFGTRQSGIPDLRMAQVSDVHLLEQARKEAQILYEMDPLLELPEHSLLAEQANEFWTVSRNAS